MGQPAGKTIRQTLPTATMRTRAVMDSGLWLTPGTVVHDAIRGRRYRVARFLGRGGFGAAYQADDVHQLGQLLAALLTGVASRKITASAK